MISYEQFKAEYEAAKDKDKWIASISKKIDTGKISYTDAVKYSQRIGLHLSDILEPDIDPETAEWDETIKTMLPSLCLAYADVVAIAKAAQLVANKRAGINMKAQEPETDKSRIFNLVQKLTDPDQDSGFLLGRDVMENFTRSAVTDTIKANAEFQSDAGLVSYITRTTGGGCCEWCESMAGTYEYGQQPDDFFQVHKDCTCEITYQPAKGRWQRITYSGGKKNTEAV